MNCKKWEVYSRIEKTMTDCSRLILPLSQVTTKYALFSYYFYEKFMNHAKLPQKFFKNWRNISLKWKKSIENEFTHLKFKWSQLNSRSEIHAIGIPRSEFLENCERILRWWKRSSQFFKNSNWNSVGISIEKR